KRNYRCLLHASDSLVVVTVGRNTAPLAINALVPPAGTSAEEFVDALCDVISTSHLLMQGARNVLKEALLSAIKARGNAATFSDALAHARAALTNARPGSRRSGWLESTIRSLEELTKGDFGTALNAKNAPSFAALLTHAIVFELQGLGDDQKHF